MALIDVYNILYEDSTLQARILGAAFLAALDVQLEDVATPSHTARISLANAIFIDPHKGDSTFLKYVAANPSIRANPSAASDNDLQFVIASNWTVAALANT